MLLYQRKPQGARCAMPQSTSSEMPAMLPSFQSPMSAGDYGGWFVSAAIVAAGSLLWLRRRLSRDNTEMVKDRAEGALLSIALAERDKAMTEAREAWDRRTQDAMEIAGLRAKNEYLQGEVNRLRQDLSLVHVQLGQVLEAMRRFNPEFQLVPQPTSGETHGS